MPCMSLLRTRSHRHRFSAATAAALYGAAIVVVPVFHARDEVAHARPAVEAEHSAHCPVVHGGPLCAMLASVQATADPAAPFALPAAAALVQAERPHHARSLPWRITRRPSVRDPPSI